MTQALQAAKFLPMVEKSPTTSPPEPKAAAAEQVRYPDFAARLTKAMAESGLSVTDLKNGIGVTYEMARRYTMGIAKPRDAKLNKLATLVGKSSAWLSYGDDAADSVAEHYLITVARRLGWEISVADRSDESCPFIEQDGNRRYPDFLLQKGSVEFFLVLKSHFIGDLSPESNWHYAKAAEGRRIYVRSITDAEELLIKLDPNFSNVAETKIYLARKVPVIGYVQAGLWTEATDSYAMGSGSEMINTDLDDLGPNAFALRIKGDSNNPDYKEGEIVIIDPSVTPIPGDMVVAKNGDDEATFKKYRPRGTDDNGKDVFELVPLNDDYPTLRSDRDGPMRIIGTMVEHRRFRKR